jgi:DNA-binding transcriptional LysR family regulator
MLALQTSPYFRDLDWDKLKAFYYAAKVKNLSHAAPFLGLDQTTFSRYILKLEKHLGYPLFSRLSNGVTLTRKGEELLGIVENMVIDMKGFTSQNYVIQNHSQKRKIRIASSHALATYLLNGFILDYNKDHPNLIFEVIGVDDPLNVVLQDVDIAIQTYNPKADHHKRGRAEEANWRVMYEPFFTLEKKLYASPEYLNQYGEPQETGDLKNHHLIAPSIPEPWPFDDAAWLLELGLGGRDRKGRNSRDPAFLSNSLECLVEAAQHGKGIIGAYDKLAIIQNANLKNILPDLIIKKHPQYFVYPEYHKDDADISAIKTYLRGRVNGQA